MSHQFTAQRPRENEGMTNDETSASSGFRYSLPMDATVVEHVWMADRRSLCDQNAVQRAYVDLSDDDYEVERAGQANASACGACLLLVAHLRRQAAAILSERESVWPEKPSEAWISLSETRWALELDLSSPAENIDASTSFDELALATNSESVAALVQSRQLKRQALDEFRGAMRQQDRIVDVTPGDTERFGAELPLEQMDESEPDREKDTPSGGMRSLAQHPA